MPRKRANEFMGYGDNNPFEQSNNPFGGDNPFGDSGVTDDGVFAPEPVGDGTLPEQQEPEPMTEAETTRPRQLPAKLIPIRCGACDRTFTLAKVSESLRCICGADALDLDLTAEANQYNTDVDSYRGGGSKTFLISWEMDGAFGQSAVKADRELDAIAWLRATMSIDKVIQVWELPEDVVASIVRQAMEGDPPLGEVVEGDQPLGLLPEPELFPQFTDDEPEVDQMVAYILRGNPHLTHRKAKWLAKRAQARYIMGAVVDTEFGSNLKPGDRLECTENTYWEKKRPGNLPQPITVDSIGVNQIKGHYDNGEPFVMEIPTAKKRLFSDSPTEISYGFVGLDGQEYRATWRKV